MNINKDPDHPIIKSPWQYRITDIHYHIEHGNDEESFLDLSLQKDDIIRHLRFLRPQNLQIGKGFPNHEGLCILDISGRQLCGIGVEVADFENSSGSISFLAQEVIDLDNP